MITFTDWFISAIPDFLMSDAIKPLWAVLLLSYIFKLILELRR